MTNSPQHDRRQSTRVAIDHPCKVFHVPTRKYLPARSRDVSQGGALIDVFTPRPLVEGDEIELLIAWSSKTVLSASEQVRARVVRAAFHGSEQTVAVEFKQSQWSKIAA